MYCNATQVVDDGCICDAHLTLSVKGCTLVGCVATESGIHKFETVCRSVKDATSRSI